MDKKILDKIKETLDSSYEIQKDIKENEEKINKQEEDYNVEKESFDKEFQKENPNNPVYMDRRNSQMTELEKLNKELQDGKKLVEVKKVELKEKFNKNKEEILKQVEDRREKMKKNYEDYKTGLINEKKEDISRKIEILKKDMENKSAVALDIMKPMLQQREEKLKLINKYLKQFELSDMLNKKVYQLSGGEQQRIAIIKLILQGSQIILADEPTSGLDKENELIVMKLLKELNEKGITIIMVTHNMNLCDCFSRVINVENFR